MSASPHSSVHVHDRRIDQDLLCACERGDIQGVRALLKKGANPNAKDFLGRTPYILAARNGYEPLLKTIVQFGGDPHGTDRFGWSAIHHAAQWGHDSVIHLIVLTHGVDINLPDFEGKLPFIIAAIHGDVLMMDRLAALGANPYLADHHGSNALHYAACYLQCTAIRHLIVGYHFDPNLPNAHGETPLLLAAREGDLETMHTLIAHGANPFICDRNGENAHTIAKEKDIPMEHTTIIRSSIML